jgi:hypothetical protein
MSIPVRNYLDADGNPICTLCGRAILPSQNVARVDDCMVHVHCYPAALTKPDPCEATP